MLASVVSNSPSHEPESIETKGTLLLTSQKHRSRNLCGWESDTHVSNVYFSKWSILLSRATLRSVL